jgi:sulfoacetaldehyde dehydrogenase
MGYMHAELDKVGIDTNLVQMVPAPASKIKTQRLMEASDLIIVTGSQDNVRRAYSSGTPAIGVGAGNATVIIDETADLTSAANKIAASKTFDNATSCSSENAIIVVDAVREPFLKALHAAGGRVLNDDQCNTLKSALFTDKGLSRYLIAKDIDEFLVAAKLNIDDADSARFVVLPSTGIGPEYPESGEKLSLALALYAAKDFANAKEIAASILSHQGAGHSVGLHSSDPDRALQLGSSLPACRVIVNQAHCFATGGSFDNGLPFSLSMGCGSWGGNSIDNNLNYRHFLNRTLVVEPIAPHEPPMEELFSTYWAVAGR